MTQSGWKNGKEDEPNACYSDADLTDDETQPFDDQFFADGRDIHCEKADEWLLMQNTMPVDDLPQCGDGFETQPVDFYGDTQVLYLAGDTQVVENVGETEVVSDSDCDHDGVESMHTQVLDECNSEVVSDSDCEGSDRTEILYETQEISDDTADSMSQLNLQNTSLFEGVDTCYKMQSDAPSNKKCHSGLVHGGFTSIRIASIRASGLAVESLAHSRATDGSNKRDISLEVITTKQDVTFVGGDISNAEREVNKTPGWEDNGNHSKDIGNENMCKLGSSAIRKLFREDTIDVIENPVDGNDGAYTGADLPQIFASENVLAGLSYVDSQEPGDESQAKALDIVDRFLQCNAFENDQDIEMGMSSVEKSKSVPSAKGTKSLAEIVTRSTDEVGGIFDWDDNCEDEGGGEFFQKNKVLLFDKKSTSPRKKPRRLDTEKNRVVGNCEDEVEHPDLCKKKDTSCSDSRVRSNSKKLNIETEKKKPGDHFLKKVNKQLIDMFDGVADNKIGNNNPDMTDVGLDTQMAAEAMQSMFFGNSLIEDGSITTNIGNSSFKREANEGQLRQSSSKKGTFSSRPATRQSLKAEQRVATSVKTSENAKKQCDEKLLGTKRTRSSARLQNAPKQNKVAERNEENAFRASNINEFDRSLDTPSNGCRSLKKRPFHEQTGSLTPVAHRTRQHIVMNQQNCTGIISNSTTEGINDEHGAFSSDKSLPDEGARTTSTKEKFTSKLGNMDSSLCKIGQIGHPKGIRTRRIRASMAQENYAQSNVRPSRSFIDGSVPVFLSLRKKRRLAEEDDSSNNAADADGVSVQNNVVNGNDSNKRSTKSDVQCKKSMDVSKANGGVEASPKDQSKASTSPTPIDCTTPRIEASPICVGDEYYKRSSRRSTLKPSVIRELNSLQTDGQPVESNVIDSRRRREMTNVRVLFSRHLDPDIIKQQKKILTRLGASLASSMLDATHFVTDAFVRTRNILEAIAFGKPVVTHLWLETCAQASCLIDEKNYILRDCKKEREFGFSMPVSLARASQLPLLQECRVFITPNTKPGTEILAGLVKAVHGLPIERCGRSAMKDVSLADDILILSCEDDYDLCVPFLEKGISVFSSELLLNGIVTQKLEYARYKLFTDRFKRTRSTIWTKKSNNQY